MKIISEFKDFIAKGNVMDLAVGVIIGGAFGGIVKSLVDDVITPAILNPALKAANVADLALLKTEGGILYGKFCLLYTSPSPRDRQKSRMPSSA